MAFEDECKINECTDCPESPAHYQLNINMFQNSIENQGQVVMQQRQEESSSWRNDHVLIDEIEEFKSIDAQQEEEDKNAPIVARSTSPTSTITDVSEEDEEEQSKQQPEQQDNTTSITTPSSTLRRSVSWKEEIITDVIYRPKTNSSEKGGLYYNSSDMQRFRQHYKMQVRAAQDYQKRLRKDAAIDNKKPNTSSKKSKKSVVPNVTVKQNRQQQHHQLYTSPISDLINKMTGYLARTSSSPSTSTSANKNSNVSIGPVADTCVLVDTLYLF